MCFGQPPPGETVLQNDDSTAKGFLYPAEYRTPFAVESQHGYNPEDSHLHTRRRENLKSCLSQKTVIFDVFIFSSKSVSASQTLICLTS
jgi:hypothetical protein